MARFVWKDEGFEHVLIVDGDELDEDEEALDLVKFKNAYSLASKAIQILSEMYDRLITQTGV